MHQPPDLVDDFLSSPCKAGFFGPGMRPRWNKQPVTFQTFNAESDIEHFEDERVVLSDGETVAGIDTVIFCTAPLRLSFLNKACMHHDGTFN